MAADRSELRRFGLLMAGMIGAVLGLLLPWTFDASWPAWPWLLAGAFAVAALVRPAVLAPVHQAWMGFAHLLGWVNTRLVLGLVFFLLVTPLGLLLRATGWDPMRRRLEPDASTYRIPRDRAPAPSDLERPF